MVQFSDVAGGGQMEAAAPNAFFQPTAIGQQPPFSQPPVAFDQTPISPIPEAFSDGQPFANASMPPAFQEQNHVFEPAMSQLYQEPVPQVFHDPATDVAVVYPESSYFVPQTYPDGLCAQTNAFPVPANTLNAEQHTCAFGDDVLPAPQSFQHAQFNHSGVLVQTPCTTLDTGLNGTVFGNSSEMPNAFFCEVQSSDRVFEASPVTDSQLDNAKPLLHFSKAQNNLLDSATSNIVDSLDSLHSKGYNSDASSDVYMNSDYTDTLTSVNSTSLLLAQAGQEHYAGEVASANTEDSHAPTYVESTPTEAACYNNDAFTYGSANKALISWSSDESVEQSTVVEEAPDHKTVTWSNTIAESICEPGAEPVAWPVSGEAVIVPENNEVTVPHEVSWASSVTEDSGAVAHIEGVAEAINIMNIDPGSALESLVQHLAEQHPGDVVNINVECVEGPACEAVAEPLAEIEFEEGASWMNSTESLHLYKLLKQGRAHTLDNLRVKALSNGKAHTMHNLHERNSFVNLTASVNNMGRACQKAFSYVRSDMEFGSMMSLRDSNLKISSSLSIGGQKGHLVFGDEDEGAGMLKKKGEPAVDSGRHTRNVIYMACLITVLLVSLNATRNLQSSLNQEGGVGIICLAVSYAAYTVGSLFSPVFVQGLGVKRCIVGGLVLELLYIAGNLYPVMFVMVPVSLGGGFSLAVIWNAMSTYIVLLARGEADCKMLSYERISERFFGIFCLIYQSNLIIGNLISSLVLTFAGGPEAVAALGNSTDGINSTAGNLTYTDESTVSGLTQLAADMMGVADAVVSEKDSVLSSNLTGAFDAAAATHYHLCGAEFCHHFVISQEDNAVAPRTVYLLFGIFMFLILVAIGISIFLLEPLSSRLFNNNPSTSTASLSSGNHRTTLGNIKRQMVALIKFCRNVKFLLLLPLLLYSNMQFTFVCSEVMMAFVTCPLGVWLVGYSMLAYGVCCSLASYATQAFVPRTGRGFFIAMGAGFNLGLLVFMRVWHPSPDVMYPLFIITSLFGLADGIWNVICNSMCGSVFPDHYEEAFTGLRVAQGLGGAFIMGYASFFCMAVKLYTMMVIVVVVILGFFGAEFLIRRDAKKAEPLYEKEIVETV